MNLRRLFWIGVRLAILAQLLFSIFSSPGAMGNLNNNDFIKNYLWLGLIATIFGFPTLLYFWLKATGGTPFFSLKQLVLEAPMGIVGPNAFSTWMVISLIFLLIGVSDLPYVVLGHGWSYMALTLLVGSGLLLSTILAYLSARKRAEQGAAANR